MRILAQKPPRYLNGQCRQKWGVLLNPPAKININQVLDSDFDFAVDNGAFVGFDHQKFLRLLGRITRQPLFVVVPDSVGNKAETLRLFDIWQPIILRLGFDPAFVIQDGMIFEDLPPVNHFFMGGSQSYKRSALALSIADQLHQQKKYLHLGGVNGFRFLRRAYFDYKAASVDGFQFSKFLIGNLSTANRYLEQFQAQPILDNNNDR